MSIPVKNIGVQNPIMWANPGAIYSAGYLEAVPHHANIRIKMKVDGTRTKTVSGIITTQVFDYEIEDTFTRVRMAFGSSVNSGARGGLDGIDDLSIPDSVFYSTPTASDCYCIVSAEAFLANGSPGHQTVYFVLPTPSAPVETTIGTHEHDGVTTGLKTNTDWTPLSPQFFHTPAPPSGERVIVNKWGITTFRTFQGDTEYVGDDPVEASVSAPASFRDLSGVNTVTISDPSAGDWDSSSVSYIYEWEIG
jgi:hypothetical protein